MREMICDRCGEKVSALYVVSIQYEGEAMLGGSLLTWDEPQGEGRRSVELCRSCTHMLTTMVRRWLEARRYDESLWPAVQELKE